MRRVRPGTAVALLAAAGLGALFVDTARPAAAPQPAHSSATVSFNRDIRPILAENCFSCHGPDERTRATPFHFDTREGAFAKAGVIVPGQAGESLLVQRITHPDPARRMPPAASEYKLTPAQIDLLRRWIDEGAPWDSHWAFDPPRRHDPPAVKRADWPRNAIDRFILARLEREGLKPSAPADKATLLRRVTYDLTGLPPTPAEVDAFLADRSPDAYETRVEALLRSPHHGERMAMPWLDTARYGDTHGYHIDSHRDMWPWRDWVIGAFNRNLPFDQFTIEQLAGDLLPSPTHEQRVATGFNRNHMINFEGGAIAEEYQVEYVVDRVEATATTFMGLTMGCARCHSHKFDPISHKEFYQFFAFFNSVPEQGLDGRTGNAQPVLALPSATQRTRLEELDAALEASEAALADANVAPLQAEWETTLPASAPPIAAAALVAHYELDGNFSDLSGSYHHGRTVAGDPTFEPGQIGRSVSFDGDTHVSFGNLADVGHGGAFSIAVWLRAAGSQPASIFHKLDASGRGYEWRLEDLVLSGIQRHSAYLTVRVASASPASELRIRTRERLPLGEWHHIAMTYDGSGKTSGVRLYRNGVGLGTGALGAPGALGALGARGAPGAPGARIDAPLQVGAKTLGEPFRGRLDDLRVYKRALTPAEVEQLAVHYPVQAIVSGLTGKRSHDEADRVRTYFLTHAAPEALRAQFRTRQALLEEKRQLEKQIPTSMVMAEMSTPRDTFVLARGDYRNRTERVDPGVPAVLPPLPKGARPNRLALAKWLVSPEHPLTARVAVNRFWQMYFGHGLTSTQEDFGVRGEPPVHPELLDWLATELVRTGWDVRAMQRLIVTSSTYRQSSKADRDLLDRDPDNRLLARGPRVRLPAEMIRDTALAASGLLTRTIGGPSVFPYQPAGLWEEMAFGDGFSAQQYEQSRGKDLYRRGLYTFWKRTVPPASLATFDAPDREKCTARRTLTNTPLQALVLLNDPTYVEAARMLAQRAILEGGTDVNDRIRLAFRLATGRKPTRKETGVLRALLVDRLASFRSNPKAARALVTVGESPRHARLDASELAAWTTVASVILNLDETITKE